MGRWQLDPGVLAGAVAYSAAYGWLAVRRWRVRRRHAAARTACFAAGVLLSVLALVSPLDAAADDSLSAHMLQHELLAAVAPLLLVAGLDAQLVAPLTRVAVRPALARRRPARVLGVLTHPVLAGVLWVAATCAWQVPALYDVALRVEPVHVLEHVSLLTAGLALWAAAVGRLPSLHGRRSPVAAVALLGLASTVGAALCGVLIWAPHELYAVSAGQRSWLGTSPLTDQRIAGALMMAIEMPLLLGGVVLLLVRAAAGRAPHPSLAAREARPLPTPTIPGGTRHG